MDDVEHCHSSEASSGKRRCTDRCRSVPVFEQASGAAQVQREEHVCITERTGRKYRRRRSCVGLNQADEIQRVGLAEAQRRGKVPCNVCFRSA